MKLNIHYSKKTGDIKQEFNKAFPFLKIEFFHTSHITGEATSRKDLVKDNMLLGEMNSFMKEGAINIHPEDTVASFEQSFQEKFLLSVQVFRKQKNVWIETTNSDHLSLAGQNEKGRSISAPELHSEPGDRYLEDGQY